MKSSTLIIAALFSVFTSLPAFANQCNANDDKCLRQLAATSDRVMIEAHWKLYGLLPDNNKQALKDEQYKWYPWARSVCGEDVSCAIKAMQDRTAKLNAEIDKIKRANARPAPKADAFDEFMKSNAKPTAKANASADFLRANRANSAKQDAEFSGD